MNSKHTRFFMIGGLLMAAAIGFVVYGGSKPATSSRPEIVELEIAKDGTVLWNGKKVDPAQLDQTAAAQKTPDIEMEISTDNTFRWNGNTVGEAELERLITEASKLKPTPRIHISPGKAAHYSTVAKVLAIMQRHGITNIGFVGIQTDR